jgi:hypothetical protein
MEVVYNTCFGGFGLSDKAIELYKRKSQNADEPNIYIRHDPLLIEVVKELGKDASDVYSDLQIETIPIEYINCYTIVEYDGMENVRTDPAALIEYKLCEYAKEINNASDTDCKDFLKSLIAILEN